MNPKNGVCLKFVNKQGKYGWSASYRYFCLAVFTLYYFK